jgi:hypothetical protein
MNHLQKLGDGEQLDGVTSAEEDFGSDPISASCNALDFWSKLANPAGFPREP